jgi:hypothetical protein
MNLTAEPITFYFDHDKKRCLSGRAEAVRRFEQQSGKKTSENHIHHLSWNRERGNTNNLFITRDQKQHDNLHVQMIQAISEIIESGLIGFDINKKQYVVSNSWLDNWIRDWRTEGRPFRMSLYENGAEVKEN